MSSPCCPQTDELRAFAVGNLAGTAFARIAGHVEACRQCEALLQEFDNSADFLVTGLKHVNEPGAKEHVALPRDLVMSACRAWEAATGTLREIAIDSGR